MRQRPCSLPLAGVALASLASLSLGTSAAGSPSPTVGTSQLYHNGTIHLNDGKGTQVHALLARQGRVVAVGELADVQRRVDAAGAERIDLGGGIALPGFQDGHVDLEELAFARSALDLSQTHSSAEMIELVAKATNGLKDGSWVVGWGWDERDWKDEGLPTHAALSARTPNHPVFLLRRDGRAALVNSAALVLAKLDGVVKIESRAVGGEVVEDGEARATGLLTDGAIELVRKFLPPIERSAYAAQLEAVATELAAAGFTGVHDLGTRKHTLETLRELAKCGKLPLRVLCYLDGNVAFDPTALGVVDVRDGGGRVEVCGVRFRLDGTVDLRRAALLEPWNDDQARRTRMLLGEDDLVQRVSAVVRHGLQPVFEAEGDRANRLALSVLDRVAASEGDLLTVRPRVESALVVATKDWPRFPALRVVPSMQPAGLAAEIDSYTPFLGERRMRGVCAWRMLAPELGGMVFGSGAPEHVFDPLAVLTAVRTPLRVTGMADDSWLPMSPLSGAESVLGFTSGAAWASRHERIAGRLQPGYIADLTVFDGDPLACAPDALSRLQITLTVVDGRVARRAR